MSMTEEELKLIERIQKLHNMALGAKEVGSLAEAESFMEAVNKTLAKHNLDSAVLATNVKDLRDPLTYAAEWGSLRRHKKTPVEWVQILAGAVGHTHFCSTLLSVSSSAVFFYGRTSNVEVARKMFIYLRDTGERLGWRAYQKYLRDHRRAGTRAVNANRWYLDWLKGFAAEVGYRYSQMRARVENNRGMALVLTGVRKEAEQWGDAHVASPEKIKENEKDVLKGTDDLYARLLGQSAAATVNLQPNAINPGAAPGAGKGLGSGRTPADFVRLVRAEIEAGEISIMYATAFNDSTASPAKIWPEIRDAAFRDAVMALLPSVNFSAPDELDDWTMSCYPSTEKAS